MSNSNQTHGFGPLIPGFDFLKNLASQGSNNASGHPMAAMSQWIAPTLSIEDIDKRINELKSVQFWLEQNLMGLKATIQALEVQKMTLSTLESMNVSMTDMAKAFTAAMPDVSAVTPDTSTWTTAHSAPKNDTDNNSPKETQSNENSENDKAETKGIVDALAWWNGISTQFGEIANATLKDLQAQSEKAAQLAAEQTQAMAQAAQASAESMSATASVKTDGSNATTTKKSRSKKAQPTSKDS